VKDLELAGYIRGLSAFFSQPGRCPTPASLFHRASSTFQAPPTHPRLFHQNLNSSVDPDSGLPLVVAYFYKTFPKPTSLKSSHFTPLQLFIRRPQLRVIRRVLRIHIIHQNQSVKSIFLRAEMSYRVGE